MKAPIKLSKSSRLAKTLRFLPQMEDPSSLLLESISNQSFSEAVSSFKFGKTFKTTKPNRHQKTDAFILSYCKSSFNFLDVGASTGITSLELIQKLDFNFNKFFVTDYNLYVYSTIHKKYRFFYDENEECILLTNGSIIAYPQESSIIERRFKKKLQDAGKLKKDKILLINPELKKIINANDSIELLQHNVLSKWPHDHLNVIKAANLFNRTYFSEEEIVKGIRNLNDVLLDNGILVIIDNRDKERSSIYQKTSSKLSLIQSIDGGTEINQLIESNF